MHEKNKAEEKQGTLQKIKDQKKNLLNFSRCVIFRGEPNKRNKKLSNTTQSQQPNHRHENFRLKPFACFHQTPIALEMHNFSLHNFKINQEKKIKRERRKSHLSLPSKSKIFSPNEASSITKSIFSFLLPPG